MNKTTYKINIAGLNRELRLIEVAPGLRIAFLESLDDIELIQVAAKELSKKLKVLNPEVIISPETKGIPLTYALAVELNCKYVILRKQHKAYMKEVLHVDTHSIGAGKKQTLYLDTHYVPLLQSSRVVLFDDVISTGSTINAMTELMKEINANIIAIATVFTEGNEEQWKDVISIGHLPLFKE
jgi:adenine phosphoribosyltransferase